MKGILAYIKEIPKDKLEPRLMYGFLKKRGRNKIGNTIGPDHKRWCFLISSRPLNKDDYLDDPEAISDDHLPPLIEFDCLYYYSMSDKNDTTPVKGEIKTIEIDKIEDKVDGKYYSMYIDSGPKMHEFMSTKKYKLQQWTEAIQLSMRTANERLYSITGSIKNISKIVTQFEMDAHELSEEL